MHLFRPVVLIAVVLAGLVVGQSPALAQTITAELNPVGTVSPHGDTASVEVTVTCQAGEYLNVWVTLSQSTPRFEVTAQGRLEDNVCTGSPETYVIQLEAYGGLLAPGRPTGATVEACADECVMLSGETVKLRPSQ